MNVKGRAVDSYGPNRMELAMAILTAVGHVTLELSADGLRGAAPSLNRPQHVYNLAVCVLWAGYVVFRAARWRANAATEWGFRRQGFWSAFRVCMGISLVAVPALTVYGHLAGHLPLPAEFWLVLLLYPLWGIAQQFALQALVTRNLRPFIESSGMRAVVAASMFSAAHFPNYSLMALTFPAGLVFTWVFERYRNLWAVGIFHGLLGALAYYSVLGENPGADLLRMLRGLY